MKVMELYDCSEFKIIDQSMQGTVHWYRPIVMDKFKQLVKKFNNELNFSPQVDLLDVTSPSKDNHDHHTNEVQDIHTNDVQDIPKDLDCFCYDHCDDMKVIAMTCCKKKVHQICLEKLLENFAQCAYCKALIDPKKAFIEVVCLKQETKLTPEINESKSSGIAMVQM